MVTNSVGETEKKAFAPTSQRSLSAVFRTQKEAETIAEQLKTRGIPIEHISVLGRATLGIPEDKMAIHQSKVLEDEYLVMVEVPVEGASEYQLLVENAGGVEVHLSDASLPPPCDGECGGPEELAPEVRNHLSAEAQMDFIATYNRILKESDNAGIAENEAWNMIRMKYQEDELGVWS
jgi:cation transport regulator ChaB